MSRDTIFTLHTIVLTCAIVLLSVCLRDHLTFLALMDAGVIGSCVHGIITASRR